MKKDGTTTLRKMSLNITTLSIISLNVTIVMNDNQYCYTQCCITLCQSATVLVVIMLDVVMLSVAAPLYTTVIFLIGKKFFNVIQLKIAQHVFGFRFNKLRVTADEITFFCIWWHYDSKGSFTRKSNFALIMHFYSTFNKFLFSKMS
jgi:hypothetical protein